MKKLTITLTLLLSLLMLSGCTNQDSNIAIMSKTDANITAKACKTVLSLNQYINKTIENDLNKAQTGTANFQIFDYVTEQNIKSKTLYIYKKNIKSFKFIVDQKNYKTSGTIFTFNNQENQKIGTGNIQQTYINDESVVSQNLIVNKISYEKSEYNRRSFIILESNINNKENYSFDFELKDNFLSGAAFKNNNLIGLIKTHENTVIIKDNFDKLAAFF